VVFKFIDRTIGLRVSDADEDSGLDASEFAQPGYVTV
jgi:ammonia channel protein AmtB